MANRKNESFTVTDRRLFTSDGELRKDVPEEQETPAPAKPSSTEASAAGMMQLGLMHQQGEPPQLDLIGARQTIDSLSLLSDKTKGNLSSKEQSFLQNALYELRMAYVEVTNAIAKGAQQVPAAK